MLLIGNYSVNKKFCEGRRHNYRRDFLSFCLPLRAGIALVSVVTPLEVRVS